MVEILHSDNSIEYLSRRVWWFYVGAFIPNGTVSNASSNDTTTTYEQLSYPPAYLLLGPLPNNTLARAPELASCEAALSFPWALGAVAIEPVTITGALVVFMCGLLLLAPHGRGYAVCSDGAALLSCATMREIKRYFSDYLIGVLVTAAGLASTCYHASGCPLIWLISYGIQVALCMWLLEVWLRRVGHAPILIRILCVLALPGGQFLLLRYIYQYIPFPSSLGEYVSGIQRWLFPLLVLLLVALAHVRLSKKRKLQPLAAFLCLFAAAACVALDGPLCVAETRVLGYPAGLLWLAHCLSGFGFCLLAFGSQPVRGYRGEQPTGSSRTANNKAGAEEAESSGGDPADADAPLTAEADRLLRVQAMMETRRRASLEEAQRIDSMESAIDLKQLGKRRDDDDDAPPKSTHSPRARYEESPRCSSARRPGGGGALPTKLPAPKPPLSAGPQRRTSLSGADHMRI